MERRKQSLDEILSNLTLIESSWRDEVADAVIDLLQRLPKRSDYSAHQVLDMLEKDFTAGMTTARLFLDLSKDEFERKLRATLEGEGGIGVTRFLRQNLGRITRLYTMAMKGHFHRDLKVLKAEHGL